MGNQKPENRTLIRDLLDGTPESWDRFYSRLAPTIWTSCRILTEDEAEARSAFSAVLAEVQANNYARLRSYNGSSRIETFVALVARDILSDRVLSLFNEGKDGSGWKAFERFFQNDIHRIIRRRLSGVEQDDARNDAYQDICLSLIEGNYRRLKAYAGKGSFIGFVLHVADRLLVDVIRKTNPRRRNPKAISSAPQFVSSDELDEMPSQAASPEQMVLDDEGGRLLEAATTVLQSAMTNLSTDEQLYVQIALSSSDPLPAREIAQLMPSPVEDIYKIKRRVMGQLQRVLENHPDVKKWLASV